MVASSFKKIIGNKEYAFYRTRVADEVVYFAIFNANGSRTSARITKDMSGKWKFVSSIPDEMKMNQASFLEAVTLNEI